MLVNDPYVSLTQKRYTTSDIQKACYVDFVPVPPPPPTCIFPNAIFEG